MQMIRYALQSPVFEPKQRISLEPPDGELSGLGSHEMGDSSTWPCILTILPTCTKHTCSFDVHEWSTACYYWVPKVPHFPPWRLMPYLPDSCANKASVGPRAHVSIATKTNQAKTVSSIKRIRPDLLRNGLDPTL